MIEDFIVIILWGSIIALNITMIATWDKRDKE